MFAGARKDGTSLKVYSLSPHRKYDPVYRLLLDWTEKGGSAKSKEVSVEFTKFFSQDGLFVPNRFEGWLKEAVPVLASEKSVDVVNGTTGDATGVDVESTAKGIKRKI